MVIDKIFNKKLFEKSDTGIETYETIEEIKFLQEYEDRAVIFVDDIKEKEKNDLRIQAMYKQPRHNN